MVFRYKRVKGMGFKIKNANRIKKVKISIRGNAVVEKRRQKREIERAERGDIPAAIMGDVSDIVVEEEMKTLIHRAINMLPPRQKEMVQKVIFEGYTMTDVAREKAVTTQTVHVHLQRAFKNLKKFLESEVGKWREI